MTTLRAGCDRGRNRATAYRSLGRTHDRQPGRRRPSLRARGALGWLYIDRPHARNAFTPAMYQGIKRAVQLVNSAPDLAALITTWDR